MSSSFPKGRLELLLLLSISRETLHDQDTYSLEGPLCIPCSLEILYGVEASESKTLPSPLQERICYVTDSSSNDAIGVRIGDPFCIDASRFLVPQAVHGGIILSPISHYQVHCRFANLKIEFELPQDIIHRLFASDKTWPKRTEDHSESENSIQSLCGFTRKLHDTVFPRVPLLCVVSTSMKLRAWINRMQ